MKPVIFKNNVKEAQSPIQLLNTSPRERNENEVSA